jgi:glycerol-3-phosphate acyltransferase PlsY
MTWVAVAFAYLIGSLPFSAWLVRWSRGADVRLLGSGNPGATNALRVAGVRVGLATLVLDIAKGYVAVRVAQALGVEGGLLGAIALTAVVGHVYPVWLRFRGGKGVATAAGTFLILAPVALVVGLVVFAVVFAISRVVSLGSVAAAVTVPAVEYVVAARGGGSTELESMIFWLGLITLLVVARHHANLRRVWAGEEVRLGAAREDA